MKWLDKFRTRINEMFSADLPDTASEAEVLDFLENAEIPTANETVTTVDLSEAVVAHINETVATQVSAQQSELIAQSVQSYLSENAPDALTTEQVEGIVNAAVSPVKTDVEANATLIGENHATAMAAINGKKLTPKASGSKGDVIPPQPKPAPKEGEDEMTVSMDEFFSGEVVSAL